MRATFFYENVFCNIVIRAKAKSGEISFSVFFAVKKMIGTVPFVA
jgi:hypothetical protein